MPTASEKLRDLARALTAGKTADPRELSAALEEGAERIDKLETLRDAVEQTAWTTIFANALNGYLHDPTVQIDTAAMRDLALNNCRELADYGLLHWRHRWAGGEAPRGYRESGELYRLDKPALQDIWTLGPDQLETTENTRKHVVGITDALDALDEKEKGARAKRSQAAAAEDGASPPPKRRRGKKEQAAGAATPSDAAEPETEQGTAAAEPSPSPAPPPAPRSTPPAAPARSASAPPAPAAPVPAEAGVDEDGCSD
jgi:hypothetical protein